MLGVHVCMCACVYACMRVCVYVCMWSIETEMPYPYCVYSHAESVWCVHICSHTQIEYSESRKQRCTTTTTTTTMTATTTTTTYTKLLPQIIIIISIVMIMQTCFAESVSDRAEDTCASTGAERHRMVVWRGAASVDGTGNALKYSRFASSLCGSGREAGEGGVGGG